ncbi:MAG: hypothetical protein JNN20_02380 [Betaproteobacteria bacterium]|nr:hypothetical protein [Betaproteobacteria bacterium]
MQRISVCLIATSLLMLASTNSHADKHVGDCSKKTGVEALRCERHMKMAEKCGPLKGDAHFQCDREFLLANPLNCGPLKGEAESACKAEVASFKNCEPKPGREFMVCVKKETGQSPMGH